MDRWCNNHQHYGMWWLWTLLNPKKRPYSIVTYVSRSLVNSSLFQKCSKNPHTWFEQDKVFQTRNFRVSIVGLLSSLLLFATYYRKPTSSLVYSNSDLKRILKNTFFLHSAYCWDNKKINTAKDSSLKELKSGITKSSYIKNIMTSCVDADDEWEPFYECLSNVYNILSGKKCKGKVTQFFLVIAIKIFQFSTISKFFFVTEYISLPQWSARSSDIYLGQVKFTAATSSSTSRCDRWPKLKFI